MSDFSKDKIQNINMTKLLKQEMEDWRYKMNKVFADQHPYTFYVTADHDFEDMIFNIMDKDASDRESQKHEPFEYLKQMTEFDRKAEKDFYQLLSKMETENPTIELKEVLEQKKRECANVFDMFDKIVSICEEYFELEYSDCSKRISKQIAFQEPVINEVEKFLVEIEEFGNAELKSLRDRLSGWVYDTGLQILENADKSYVHLSEQPFAMTVWFENSAALTSKEVRFAFLADQKEMSNLWKKAFNDVLMLSAKLVNCRCNNNLMKFKLEREIFWMSKDYKENMPELTKIQRHLASLIDEKVALKLEMKSLKKEVEKEQKKVIQSWNKMHRKTINAKAINKFAHETAYRKIQMVLSTKKEEVYNFLNEVLIGDQFIHEEILGVSWNPVDLSCLKSDDKNTGLESDLGKIKTSLSVQRKSLNRVDKHDFSSAFNILASSEKFVNLLNKLSDELGYMLDFKWVNFVKEKLELAQEVKWIELFKVFKINFDELGELKEHMISCCKFGDDNEVIDINSAVDGFLNFVWKKRHSSPHHVLPAVDFDPEECKNYWSLATSIIPKSLLWENVQEVLIEYLELLESRSNLLKRRYSLLVENQEFENCLENYYKHGTF